MNMPAAIVLATGLIWLSAQAADTGHGPAPGKAESPAAKAGMTNIGVQDFERLRQDKKNVVLDVRTPAEYASGHIPGAVNIDVNAADFEKKIKELDQGKTYLVHCAAGVRSVKACDKMSQLRFGHLYNLEGGYKAWTKAGNKGEQLNDIRSQTLPK